ncbi:hypothetical protein [Rhodoferax mekongensis]|uniref:hypothetical protein n=1 Tax=Rhodoferax mekongensis TaxID=3068341 RepID=UPI0028BECE11|nr:hypothetical protein [Rhodoferax sp. TBRC 17199]MDT7517101.1 hypothetical protein [Rhodoferax sp. TBRC 17199]
MTKNSRQVLKLIVHAVIVLLCAFFIVIAYQNGILNEQTQVPTAAEKLLSMVMSTWSFYVGLVLLAVAVLAHKFYGRHSQMRGKIRLVFFYILAFLTGKLYWWAGLCFGMWVLGWYIPSFETSSYFLVLGFGCWLVGLVLWDTAREVAFKNLR